MTLSWVGSHVLAPRKADRRWVSSGPIGVPALGRCAVSSGWMGVWSPQDLLVLQICDFLEFSSGIWESGHWGPTGALALGHCGVHFKLTGVWSPQDPLGFQIWYILGFNLGWWESGPSGPIMTLALGHCGVSSGWWESCLLRTCWCFSSGTLWGLIQSDRSLVFSGPTGISALGHCGVQFREMGVWH